MRFEQIKKLKDEEFRRLTGVKKAPFERMVEILDIDEKKQIVGVKANSA